MGAECNQHDIWVMMKKYIQKVRARIIPLTRNDSEVKICTRVAITNDGRMGKILDISVVDASHHYGFSDDGNTLHVEGYLSTKMRDDRIV